MKDKLWELAKRWKSKARIYPANGDSEFVFNRWADELLASLDAEGDGGAVDFPRYRAIGFDAETNCAEMVADPDGAWVHVLDITQNNPARSGVVSDEDVRDAARYRWLRDDPPLELSVRRFPGETQRGCYLDGYALDQAIDAAIQGEHHER